MCGIIAVLNSGKQKHIPANEAIANQYEEQFRRGTEGFGIINLTPKKRGVEIDVRRATEPAKMFFDLYNSNAPMVVMHHRTPTSTDNSLDQTHPIYVSNGSLVHDYLVVHNGIIHNKDEVHKKHQDELGFVYTTIQRTYTTDYLHKETVTEKFNDSEALAIDVARFIEGNFEKSASGSVLDVVGSAAFIAVQIDKKTSIATALFYGRNTNPLMVWKEKGNICISSEGEGTLVPAEKMFMIDLTKKGALDIEEVGDFQIKSYQAAAASKTYENYGYPASTYHTHTGALETKRIGFNSSRDDDEKVGIPAGTHITGTKVQDVPARGIDPDMVSIDLGTKSSVELDEEYITDISKREVMYESLLPADKEKIEEAEFEFQAAVDEKLEKHRADATAILDEFFDKVTDVYSVPDVTINQTMSIMAKLLTDAIRKGKEVHAEAKPEMEELWNKAMDTWMDDVEEQKKALKEVRDDIKTTVGAGSADGETLESRLD